MTSKAVQPANPLPKYDVILGSASPRRRLLLEGLDVEFTSQSIDADESFDELMPVEEVPEYLARKKSQCFEGLKQGELLITADTVVVLDNRIVNKPKDLVHARTMISSLSHKSHNVITGVCLRTLNKTVCFCETSTVNFEKLTNEEIEYYVQKYKPLDKAGAYGIQEWLGYIGISSINGCYYNVMGLPLNKLYRALCEF